MNTKTTGSDIRAQASYDPEGAALVAANMLDRQAALTAELMEALAEYVANGHSVPTFRKAEAALAKARGGAA